MRAIHKLCLSYINKYTEEYEECEIFGSNIQTIIQELKTNYFYEGSGGKIDHYYLTTLIECEYCGIMKDKENFDFLVRGVDDNADVVCGQCVSSYARRTELIELLNKNKNEEK